MYNKLNKLLSPTYVSRYLGIIVIILLVVFEVLIDIDYAPLNAGMGLIIAVIICEVVLNILCSLSIFKVKRMRSNLILYCCDFALLLAICTITGSSYLSALYCIILSQFYFSIDDFKSQLIVFLVSCISYSASFIVGYIISHGSTSISNYDIAVNIISGGVLGLIILTIHFFIALFFIHYYKTNVRLTQALKDADESKARLKEAYEELSEKAVYEERNRIARDIHDNAGHSMTAVIMQTEAAKLLVDTNPEEAKMRIVSANIQAKNALEQMRDSVHILAGNTEKLSLKDDIEEILARSVDSTDIKIRKCICDVALSESKHRFITNSIKECIANGIRHGEATAFYVELVEEDGWVSLTVSDNGVGLPKNFKEGFGLKGIREKAVLFGGNVKLNSEENDGLEIIIKFPVETDKDKI